MAKKESRSGGYEALRAAVKAGVPANLYIFYGEERYLLQTMAQRLKELLIPAGFEEFNYHRLTGKGLTVQELAETAEAMPMMAEHTLITVTDMDIFKLDEGQRTALIDLLSDFPPYCTLIFLYEQLTYKRDGKMKKLCAALNEYVQEVEFVQQERKDLLNWLKRRFAAVGHDIDQTAADHLLFTCGSLMRGLIPEIEKIAAYAKHERITMADIDAVAEPVLDARIFDMTNAVTARNYDRAAGVLAELLRMQMEPIAILAALGKELRRLAEKRGVILLTDPDGAGFVIRNHLKGILPPEQVKQAYVPDVYGKERRKKKGGKEGKLGVEGMPPQVLIEALRRAGATFEDGTEAPQRAGLTKADMLEKGLIGPASAEKRAALQRRLGLPEHLTANGLMEALDTLLTREEFDAL